MVSRSALRSRLAPVGLALLAARSWNARVGAHPLCFYNDRPTDFDQVVTFCPQPQEGACCNDFEEAAVEAAFNNVTAIDGGPLTEECADYHKQVLCGVCNSYSAHLYERLGSELGEDGMTMKTPFCHNYVSACSGQIEFPTYGDEDYCEKHVGSVPFGAEGQLWSYPYEPPVIPDGEFQFLFDEEMYEAGDLPQDSIDMRMSPDSTKWWIAGLGGEMFEVSVLDLEQSTLVMDLSDKSDFFYRFEEGLLSFAFSPDFTNNNRFYVSYSAERQPTPLRVVNRLSMFVHSNSPEATLASEEVVLQSNDRYTRIHAGGWVGFKPSDYNNGGSAHDIYWTAGDSGPQTDLDNRSQDPTNLHGTMVRITVPTTGSGYSIPSGNLDAPGALPEICSYGFRNPFRCSFDRLTDDLFCGDVGHIRVESIYKVECGKNYGWGKFEGRRCQAEREDIHGPCDGTDRSGFEFPIFEYCHPDYFSGTPEEDPNTDGEDICGQRALVGNSVIGGFMYHGQLFSEVLGNTYVFGDADPQNKLYYMKEIDGEWKAGTILADGSVWVIAFAEDNAGELYVLTREFVSGDIYDWRVILLPCGDLCSSTCLDQAPVQPLFTSLGCYADQVSDRALTLAESNCPEGERAMTPSICASYCATLGADFFGVQFSYQCFCGSASDDYARHGSRDQSECTTLCTAFPNSFCGGFLTMEVFSLEILTIPPTPAPGVTPPPTSSLPPVVSPQPTASPAPVTDGFTAAGCYEDSSSDRLLTGAFFFEEPTMTAEGHMEMVSGFHVMTTRDPIKNGPCGVYSDPDRVCAALCAGSAYFGTEYGNQCFCGVASDVVIGETTSTACTYPCAGDANEICGGYDAISVYQPAVSLSTPTPTPDPTNSGPIAATPSPVGTGGLIGCFTDSTSDRFLSGLFVKGDPTMTAEVCAAFCAGSTYYGTEYSNECFCSAPSDTVGEPNSNECSFACAGDADEICGGSNAISVYQADSTPPAPTPVPTNAGPIAVTPAPVDGGGLVGCFADSSSDRLLTGELLTSSDGMTAEACAAFCEGSEFYGTEYSIQCFCSVPSDVIGEPNSNACTYACSGDADEICGGYDAITVYSAGNMEDSTPAPASVEEEPVRV